MGVGVGVSVGVGVGVGTDVSNIVISILTFFHSVPPKLELASTSMNVSVPSSLKSSTGANETFAVSVSSITKVPSGFVNPRSSKFVSAYPTSVPIGTFVVFKVIVTSEPSFTLKDDASSA